MRGDLKAAWVGLDTISDEGDERYGGWEHLGVISEDIIRDLGVAAQWKIPLQHMYKFAFTRLFKYFVHGQNPILTRKIKHLSKLHEIHVEGIANPNQMCENE